MNDFKRLGLIFLFGVLANFLMDLHRYYNGLALAAEPWSLKGVFYGIQALMWIAICYLGHRSWLLLTRKEASNA